MIFRLPILFFLLSILLDACGGVTNKAYTITTYFTRLDSGNSMGNHNKKFKYLYEEYDADSNLMYQEVYASPDYLGNLWGKLLERRIFYYNGREKIKEEIEFDISFQQKRNTTYTFEYENGSLARLLSDGKPVEQYSYDSSSNLVEKKVFNSSGVSEYYLYSFGNGLELKTEYFLADTLVYVDTVIYNGNRRVIETFQFDKSGKKIQTIFNRNDKGQVIKEKWREGNDDWTPGRVFDDDFYFTKKYFYDANSRLMRVEQYTFDTLIVVYDIVYN